MTSQRREDLRVTIASGGAPMAAIEHNAEIPAQPSRRKTLGTPHLLFFVVAAAAPVGFVLSAVPLAIGRGGIGTVGAFIVTAVVLLLFAVGFVAMAQRVQQVGGLYEFVVEGIGRVPGVGAAYVAVATYALAAIGATGAFAVFADIASQDLLGFEVPWIVWALGVAALMGVFGILRIEANAKILGAIIVVEIAMLLVVACVIVWQGGAEGPSIAPWQPKEVFGGHSGAMFAVTFAAFAGFEATAIYSDEVKNKHSIARATFLVIVALAALYSFVTWALITAYGNIGAVSAAATDPTTMFFTATQTYVGTWAVRVFEVLIVASWFASILAFHNATARYLATIGSNGMAPKWLNTTRQKSGTPWKASVSHTALTFVVIAAFAFFNGDPYLDLYILGSTPAIIGIPLLELLAGIAIICYFYRRTPSRTRTVVLVTSGLAAACLAAVIAAIIANIELFTARTGAANVIVSALMFLLFLGGMAWALLRRDHTNPHRAHPRTPSDQHNQEHS
ncbi:hypothetical protein CH259_00500 [Rhodococcus sp. 05-2254-4]|nr:hypothetical protein CH259_00500 [Rhodococcus sp. 05-2254-4]OZE47354.1 hypothetical protein CH261_10260 [Rhodococcus sp. 05-2254-3]OZE47653.1 hypothetical protein CH283_18375 [Rhodococcus sp. 05-2254-2]